MTLLVAFSAGIWLYLLFARGFFWRGDIRDEDFVPAPPIWPAVTAIIPARNEADGIARVIETLAIQDYAGPFDVILVDDQSEDGTSETARAAATRMQFEDRLTVLSGTAPDSGWTGKLNALQQGYLASAGNPSRYIWLTDADIAYTPEALSSLVRRAESGRYLLTSLMAKLRCESLAERLLVPAFIFFFQKLYPFAWVNDPGDGTAAAAGGCMLVRRDALDEIGGFVSIRGALIDDCTLGAKLKSIGPIWLGLTNRALSLRPYSKFGDIRRMVSRSAYAQFSYSPAQISAAMLGMLLVYIVPPIAAIFAHGEAAGLGMAIWLVMAAAFAPTALFYRRSPLWGLALPLIALFYLAFMLDSAYQHSRGRGGLWKGRAQAMRS